MINNNNFKRNLHIDDLIKDAVENPQIKARNMIINTFHKVAGDFKAAGNPIKLSLIHI